MGADREGWVSTSSRRGDVVRKKKRRRQENVAKSFRRSKEREGSPSSVSGRRRNVGVEDRRVEVRLRTETARLVERDARLDPVAHLAGELVVFREEVGVGHDESVGGRGVLEREGDGQRPHFSLVFTTMRGGEDVPPP